MIPIVPDDAGLIDEVQVRLVDEGRGFERVIGSLAANEPIGLDAQFLVDEGQKSLGRARIPGSRLRQEHRDVGRTGHGGIVTRTRIPAK